MGTSIHIINAYYIWIIIINAIKCNIQSGSIIRSPLLFDLFWPSKVNLIVYRFAPLYLNITKHSRREAFSSVAKQQAQPNYTAKEYTAEQLMRIQKTQLQMPDITIDKITACDLNCIDGACNFKWDNAGQHNLYSVLHSTYCKLHV